MIFFERIFVGFLLLVVLLAGEWIKRLHTEIAQLNGKVKHLEQQLQNAGSPPAQPEAPPPAPVDAGVNLASLRAQLQSETAKLNDLLRAQGDAGGRSDDGRDLDKQIEEARANVQELTADLNKANQDRRVVEVRSNAFKAKRHNDEVAKKVELENQIRVLMDRMRDLQAQGKVVRENRNDPDRGGKIKAFNAEMDQDRGLIEQMRAQVHVVEAQIKEVDAEVAAEVNAEDGEISRDVTDLKRQLADANGKLKSLQDLKAQGKRKTNEESQRSVKLRQAISEQRARVAQLQRSVDDLQRMVGPPAPAARQRTAIPMH